MASELDLTTWGGARPWVSTGTRLQQKTESLNLQFKYGTSTYKDVIRFLANGDLRIMGELVTENGSLRSYATFAMTVHDTVQGDPQDIVSFRGGGAEGTEVLRIESDGALSSTTGVIVKNSTSGDGDVLSLVQGTSDIAAIGKDSIGIFIRSEDTFFSIQQSDGLERASLNWLGWCQFTLNDDDGVVGINMTVQESSYAYIRVGGTKSGSCRQGRVFIDYDGTEDDEVAGWLGLVDKNGDTHYLWVDASGDLRIKNGVPSSDTDGTVVGTQT